MEGRQGTVGSVERAADVLLLFARANRPNLGVTEISTELGLSKAVVHRVLTTLVAKGLLDVETTTRRYVLGPAVVELGAAFLERADVRSLALPTLHELSVRTNETATLSLLRGDERYYIEQVIPDREVKMTVPIGRSFPLHAGGTSKAFLAFLPDDVRRGYLDRARLDGLTDATLTDRRRLEEDLVRIRERGYAVSLGERQNGAASIAAPVFDHGSSPAAVVSVCGPLDRFQHETEVVAGSLLEATAELTRRLGGVMPSRGVPVG